MDFREIEGAVRCSGSPGRRPLISSEELVLLHDEYVVEFRAVDVFQPDSHQLDDADLGIRWAKILPGRMHKFAEEPHEYLSGRLGVGSLHESVEGTYGVV